LGCGVQAFDGGGPCGPKAQDNKHRAGDKQDPSLGSDRVLRP
jgi:hypothetical protein